MTLQKGKILITKLNDRLYSLLIRGAQILSIQVHRATDYAVGNIYIGKVQNISQNIGAAFIDIGSGCLTFLPLSETKHAFITNRKPDGCLKPGDELLVQLAKEPMKTKLASVTTDISLSGNYIVAGLKNSPNTIQVSAKLSKKQHDRFRNIEALQQLGAKNFLIIRTNAGTLQDDSLLIQEAEQLVRQLEHIKQIAAQRTCYSCLHHVKPGYMHFIENAYTAEYDEVVTDIPSIYTEIEDSLARKGIPVRLYEDTMLPLYKLYSLETRIKELLDKKVWLKSGGYLVIEPTEALISIDVNSGKCEQGKKAEETFFHLNLEAAEMIATHLRARNLSGMILVDFINLKDKSHEKQLMEHMRNLLKKDNITADVVDMTGLGLMEITRKKVNPSFYEQYHGKY